MIKCVECGKVIAGGGPRYSTPIGSFCQECWSGKDQKFKDDMLKRTLYMLKRTLYELGVTGENLLNKIKYEK